MHTRTYRRDYTHKRTQTAHLAPSPSLTGLPSGRHSYWMSARAMIQRARLAGSAEAASADGVLLPPLCVVRLPGRRPRLLLSPLAPPAPRGKAALGSLPVPKWSWSMRGRLCCTRRAPPPGWRGAAAAPAPLRNVLGTAQPARPRRPALPRRWLATVATPAQVKADCALGPWQKGWLPRGAPGRPPPPTGHGWGAPSGQRRGRRPPARAAAAAGAACRCSSLCSAWYHGSRRGRPPRRRQRRGQASQPCLPLRPGPWSAARGRRVLPHERRAAAAGAAPPTCRPPPPAPPRLQRRRCRHDPRRQPARAALLFRGGAAAGPAAARPASLCHIACIQHAAGGEDAGADVGTLCFPEVTGRSSRNEQAGCTQEQEEWGRARETGSEDGGGAGCGGGTCGGVTRCVRQHERRCAAQRARSSNPLSHLA